MLALVGLDKVLPRAEEVAVDAAVKGAVSGAEKIDKHLAGQSDQKSDGSDPQEGANGQDLPSLSVAIIASSLIKLNARTGIIKDTQYQIARFLSWKQPAFTVSVLIIFTVICFHPYLLVAMPSLGLLFGVLIPGFESRHPGRYVDILPVDGPRGHQSEFDELADYTPRLDPPLLDEKDRDILLMLRKLQNSLTRVVHLLEMADEFLHTTGNFKNEHDASALYLIILLGLPPVVYAASFIPVHHTIAVGGWLVALSQHPVSQAKLTKIKVDYKEYFEQNEVLLETAMKAVAEREIIIDEPPEESTVEIFELQRQGLTPRQYDPWVYSPAIYGSNSPYRISQERPPGTRFLEDVKPPKGWYFDDNFDWQLDPDTKSWAILRGVRNIEIDVDESWAYDLDNDGRRGEWRRRRYVRRCFRTAVDTPQ